MLEAEPAFPCSRSSDPSGGERQRMTIMRPLLAQPRVIIIDGATAALDSMSEAAVQTALSEVLEGRASMVIEDGSIVERGTHEELHAAAGRHEELHRTQFAVQKSVAADEDAAGGT